MKKYLLALLFLSFSNVLLANVYIDPSIRPCDPNLESQWLYTPTPVEAPGSPKMIHRCDGKVKVFEVTAGIVMSTFDNSYEPGPIYTWGYNGSNPGPVMEFLEGETIRVVFKNELPEPTVLHYHGLEVPFNQDGAEGHSQISVKPGETFVYEFQVNQHGTFMYHSGQNLAKQLSMGLVGFLIVHPKAVPETLVDHDFLYFLQMYSIPPHSIFPDVMEMMMFNYFTFNGKVSPYTPSPLTYVGQKARIRFANMSMMEHPVHLHGHTWRVVATGAGDNPRSTHTYGNTILVPTSQTMDVIIDEIDTPGEWMFHCHLPHHVTNNMDVDIIPGEPMYMGNGGMHAVFKVYKGPNDPGYVNPNEGETGGSHGGSHGGGHDGMSAPKITTYDGSLKLSNGTRFDITLELYKAQEDKEWRKAKAFLKLFLNRDEFVVFHYNQVKFNFETSLMSLEGDEKALTLSNLMFMENDDMGMLTGDASVDFGALSGEVSLTIRDNEMTEMRLKNELSVSGEYEATCNSKKQSLQLISARSMNNTEAQGNNPLASFALFGTLGSEERIGIQVSSAITEGLYNPFKQSLRLQLNTAGNRSTLLCDTIIKGNKITDLKCNNGCQYSKKSSIVTSNPRPAVKPVFVSDEAPIITQLTEDKDISGIFGGALRLARNNEVVPMNLKIVAKRYATNSMVITQNHISGTVELMLSERMPMTFKLKERTFLDSASVVNKGKNLLEFLTTEKLSLVITRWSKDTIFGEAYHEDFGYLGDFITKRGLKAFSEIIRNIEDVRTVAKLDGEFSDGNWILQINSAEVEEGTGPGIYSPLHLKGRLVHSSGAMTVNFVSGSYDFALGTLYLRTDDDRIFKGSISGNDLELLLVSRTERRSSYLNLATSKLKMKRK